MDSLIELAELAKNVTETPTSYPTAMKIDNCYAGGLANTISGSASFFAVLFVLFELVRRLKALYLKRYRKKFRSTNRVPDPNSPPNGIFAWIPCVIAVSDDDFLRMVGLDGLMFIRFIAVCFKISCFLLVAGFLILLPVYATAGGNAEGWCQYTLSNIPDEKSLQLWVPVIFAYIFSAFFCNLMYEEYKMFVKRRLLYFQHGDTETPIQTNYTVILENLPADLQSTQMLTALMEDIFPGQVHSVELSLDLRVLDKLVQQRLNVCCQLEKYIACYHATKKRPKISVKEVQALAMTSSVGENEAGVKGSDSTTPSCCPGYKYIDAIDFYRYTLSVYNTLVIEAQKIYVPNNGGDEEASNGADIDVEGGDGDGASGGSAGPHQVKKQKSIHAEQMSQDILLGVVQGAANGAFKGLKATTKRLKMLTVGTQSSSSTAFVTFKSRETACEAVNGVLTQEHYGISVAAAPNPFDILWYNVHVSKEQYEIRHSIADTAIIFGAFFWSFFVAFISTSANLDSISRIWPYLEEYKNNNPSGYALVNNYVAYILLFIIIAILPLIFDVVARKYECVKCESRVQESIMNRFFYYQLANVVVSITALTVQINIDDIINDPGSIIALLGDALPQVSLYFAGFMTLNAFMMIPLELLETWPLIYFSLVVYFTDKKKATRRELRTKAFSDFPMLYGWVYPMQLLSFMIMTTYSCISPFLMPFCSVYFGLSYLMYKYQLLFVYVNKYQTGGYFWYSIFSKSMISLIGGVLVLLAYIILKATSNQIQGATVNGPLYCLLPLPIFILYFWRDCENRFKNHSKEISLHSAAKIDRSVASRMEENRRRSPSTSSDASVTSFLATSTDTLFPVVNLYKQPSLIEPPLTPEPYRRKQGIARSRSQEVSITEVMSPMTISRSGQELGEHLIQNMTGEIEDFFEEACDEILGTLDPNSSELEDSPILDDSRGKTNAPKEILASQGHSSV